MHASTMGSAHSVDVSVGVSGRARHESTDPGSRGPPHAPVIHAPTKPHTSTPSIAERRLVMACMEDRITRGSAGSKAKRKLNVVRGNRGDHRSAPRPARPGNRNHHLGPPAPPPPCSRPCPEPRPSPAPMLPTTASASGSPRAHAPDHALGPGTTPRPWSRPSPRPPPCPAPMVPTITPGCLATNRIDSAAWSVALSHTDAKSHNE